MINQKCLKQGEKKESKVDDACKISLKDDRCKCKYITNNITCKLHVVVQLLSCVWLFATPWTAAHQASLSFAVFQFAQTCGHWVGDAIQPSQPLLPPSTSALNLSQHESFQISQPFASGGQNVGASASVLPMNIQDWFPLGLTGLISLQSKGLLRITWIFQLKGKYYSTG